MIAAWGGKKTSAYSAAMLNSSFIQGFELDDYYPAAPLHSNAILLPAMLPVLHKHPDLTGKEFLFALILGYEIAGRPLRVRFAGEAMLHRFAPALEHLRRPEAPEGTHVVSVWDAASTRTDPAPVSVPDESPLGTVFTHSDLTRRALYMVGLRSLSVFDAEANASWYWTGDAARLPGWECACPIRHVLQWWLSTICSKSYKLIRPPLTQIV